MEPRTRAAPPFTARLPVFAVMQLPFRSWYGNCHQCGLPDFSDSEGYSWVFAHS
jgi:hypothetical protein